MSYQVESTATNEILQQAASSSVASTVTAAVSCRDLVNSARYWLWLTWQCYLVTLHISKRWPRWCENHATLALWPSSGLRQFWCVFQNYAPEGPDIKSNTINKQRSKNPKSCSINNPNLKARGQQIFDGFGRWGVQELKLFRFFSAHAFSAAEARRTPAATIRQWRLREANAAQKVYAARYHPGHSRPFFSIRERGRGGGRERERERERPSFAPNYHTRHQNVTWNFPSTGSLLELLCLWLLEIHTWFDTLPRAVPTNSCNTWRISHC